MISKVTKLWKQKNGKPIRICDMTDGHLDNCIALLERAAEIQKVNLSYPCFSGEMAQYYAEQDWDRAMTATPEYFYPIYEDLVNEKERRIQINENPRRCK